MANFSKPNSFPKNTRLLIRHSADYVITWTHLSRYSDRFTLKTSCINNYNTNALGPNEFQPLGTLSLNSLDPTYPLNVEDRHGPNHSNPRVSLTPICLYPGQHVRGRAAYNSENPHHLVNSNCPAPNTTLSNHIISSNVLAESLIEEHCQAGEPISRRLSEIESDLWKLLPSFLSSDPGDNLNSHETAYGRNQATDATPCSDFDPQGTSKLEDSASNATNIKRENVDYAARPLQCSSSADFTGLEPPLISAPSKIPTPHSRTQNINRHHLEPSNTTIACKYGRKIAPRTTNSHGLEASNVSTQPEIIPNTTIPKDLKLSSVLAARPIAPKLANLSTLQPLDVSTIDDGDTCMVDSSGPNPPNLSCPLPLDTSDSSRQDYEDDPDTKMFKALTIMYDDDAQQASDSLRLSETCEIRGLDAPHVPNVNTNHVADAFEPRAGQYGQGQPVENASTKEALPPQSKCRQGKKSKALPAGLELREKKNKKKATKPEGVCKIRSASYQRANCTNYFFCPYPTCRASQESNFRGFHRRDALSRHLVSHGPCQYYCPLPHKKDKDHFHRLDQLGRHLKTIHPQINPAEEKEILSQRHKMQEIKIGENAIEVPVHR